MSNVVYVVNCGDTGCDDYGYIASASVYATRESAQAYMERAVREDEQCLEVTAVWDEDENCPMATLSLVSGRLIVYTLEEQEVKP